MLLHRRNGRLSSFFLVAVASVTLVYTRVAFVHGPQTRHGIENAAHGRVAGYSAGQEITGEYANAGHEIEQDFWWQAAVRSLLVGAALGLIVGTTGLASPSNALSVQGQAVRGRRGHSSSCFRDRAAVAGHRGRAQERAACQTAEGEALLPGTDHAC